ncbi:hypothetical protein CEXT_750671 [Caerostris extrusa]|uniref:Uncharacterized protein n=1 Tax=Caerostris extrusa TaxID=172846 RepID=A0AAV4TLX0_CAEEX|nr:hypothetical protein CEXT_750671 [Caerostris extrusa]
MSLLVMPIASHPCQLWENEGTHLSEQQLTELNSLLEKYEPTRAENQSIRSNESTLVVISQLLYHSIELVLIPKSNRSMRLCIDYRKLNSLTVPDFLSNVTNERYSARGKPLTYDQIKVIIK